MKRRNPKRKTEKDVYKHFRNRMEERFNIRVSETDWKAFKPEKSTFVFRESRSRVWFLIEVPHLKFNGFYLYQSGLGATTVYTDDIFKENFPEEYSEIFPHRKKYILDQIVHQVLIDKGYTTYKGDGHGV